MESSEQGHSHYWPGEGCIPITPQAVRFGYVFPVYVTKNVWRDTITWTPQKGKETSAEKRIYDLLDSCWKGMGKALATEPDMVYYSFKHWFWNRARPASKKPSKQKLGARLLLDPESEEPWLLIFNPGKDDKEVLKHGKPAKDTEAIGEAGETRTEGSTTVDERNGPTLGNAHIGTTEGG